MKMDKAANCALILVHIMQYFLHTSIERFRKVYISCHIHLVLGNDR
jgi:hypothetical protein